MNTNGYSDSKLSDNSTHSSQELDDGIFFIPTSPTVSTNSIEINILNKSFSANATSLLHINNNGHSDDKFSDSSTHSSQELGGGILSVPTSLTLSTSSVEISILNKSFNANAVKPSHVDSVPIANTESINN